MDQRGLIEEIFKLVGELRASGLKSKLSPEPKPEMGMDEGPADQAVDMPGAEAKPEGAEPDMDPEMLKKLLESMGGE